MFDECLVATEYHSKFTPYLLESTAPFESLLILNASVVNWRELYYKCELPRPISTVDPEYKVTAVILFVVQTLFFIPRITTRLFGLGQWYKDDATCVAAYVRLNPENK